MAWTFYNSSGEALVQNAESVATQAQMEAGTSTTAMVSAGRTQNHPGVAKAFCVIEGAGTLQAGSHNVASITDTGTGDSTVVIDTDFSGSGYTVASNSYDKDVTAFNVVCNTFAAGSVRNATYDCEGNALVDTQRGWIAYGDQ
jgi:CO dehydrogenase/acetyl-CoA synthase gamma subunit (corrinoid Fe-S protein)